MAGAFVGVADDATAVYWNPAGLATGASVSGVFEIGGGDVLLDKNAPLGPGVNATRASQRMIATTGTSFGVSSYRIALTELRAPGGESPGALTRLRTTNYGATLVQTVAEGVVIGGTLRLVRGNAAMVTAPLGANVDDVLDAADDLPSRTSTTFDLDAGIMLAMGVARIGLLARNIRQPEFDLPNTSQPPLELRRHTRIGLAITPGRQGATPGGSTSIGLDFDITKVDTPHGRQRDLALGAEQWLFGRRLGVRGGGRWNVLDRAQRAVTTGLSVALKQGSYVDAFASRGRVANDRSWGVSTRVTF